MVRVKTKCDKREALRGCQKEAEAVEFRVNKLLIDIGRLERSVKLDTTT